MDLNLQRLQHMFRKVRLLDTVEHTRYWMNIARNYKKDLKFVRQNPDFPVPPKHLAYDAFGGSNWPRYKVAGEETAEFIVSLLQKHCAKYPIERILEWGCGPGRVIRHLPRVMGSATTIFGSDYNSETIEWCRQHIEPVTFVQNKLNPPLPFEESFIDCIYAISVLTHLSETLCREWIAEIKRVLKPKGLLILTTKCDYENDHLLLPQEKKTYNSHGIIVRGNVQEGKKMFGAFHSPIFMQQKLLKGLEILEYKPAGCPCNSQDLWIAKKT